MPRSKAKTRNSPRSHPQGVLKVMSAGFAFVQTSEGEFFIPASKLKGAFDGDLVELAALPAKRGHVSESQPSARAGGKPTARVVRVIERAHTTLIGRYEVAEPFGVIVPEDRRIPYDIFTMRADNPALNDGDIVRVRITEYPSPRTAAMGVVEELVGHEGEEALGIEMIIARHKLETRFSDAANEQAQKTTLDVQAAFEEGYRDLRGRKVFTIDPLDARDFDDAVSLEPVEGLMRLGVHIADASRYVPWGSAIDQDAQVRATSVYLADRVLPMLPEELSAGICSLKPGAERLTMTVDLFLDAAANLERYEIYPAVIRSSARFDYDSVQAALDGDRACNGFLEEFAALDRIAEALAKKRSQAGGIDFVTTEAKVTLDEAGKPLEVVLRKKTDATSIIEEAMVLANATVAKHLHEQGFPCLYRAHAKPSADDLAELIPILREFDYLKDVPAPDFIAGNPFCIQKTLAACKGRLEEELISSLVLRAMSRAVYQPLCEPHYALALPAYCHFTSPIRRYPDLVVHRMLKAAIFGKSGTFEQEANRLDALAKSSSKAERVAESAERESQELKIIEYLQSYVGSSFSAVISGVMSFGFFVRLENTAEGLVPVRSLGGEYFAFDPKRHTLTGEESGKVFRLGQRVQVILEAADPRSSRLDFRVQ